MTDQRPNEEKPMIDEHVCDWTTADARKWLENWCCFSETGIYIESYPYSQAFGSYVVYGTNGACSPGNVCFSDVDNFTAGSIVSALEALPQLLGYIEELEEIVECMDDNGLSALMVLSNRSNQDTISQQAAEIERLKAELADAKSDIAALHGDSEAI